MITQSNVALMSEMYAAAQRGDVDSFVAGLSPDVVVIEPAFLPYGGSYHGIDEFLRLFGGLVETFDVPRLSIEWIVADGDNVLGLVRLPLAGRTDALEVIEQSKIRVGKVVEMRIFVHSLGGLQAR